MTARGFGGADGYFGPRTIACERRADGSLILANEAAMPAPWPTLVHAIRHWAAATPSAPMLGEWRAAKLRTFSYDDIWTRTTAMACHLLTQAPPVGRPLAIVAGNSVDHAILAIAAMRLGLPVAPVSIGSAAPGADPARLKALLDLVEPWAVHAGPDACVDRVAATGHRLLAAGSGPIEAGPARLDELAAREATLRPDTIAKLLFTSGSTGTPRAVINTHRMLSVNQAQLSSVWPGLDRRPPVLVDWLPWSHTFGGNFTFNLAVSRGGAFFIDPGKPVPALIGQTLASLSAVAPSAYFNVPAGYEMLLPLLEADAPLAARFFGNVDFLFCAAAAMSQGLRDRLDALARSATGRPVPLLGGWGATETAPCCTALWFDTGAAANIGAPLPGVRVKLVPAEGKAELRVKGPNVMPGYWRDAAATAAAFDAEGYYRIGDAGRLADPDDPAAGLIFDGRIAENFKLASGTWVNVGALRLAVIEAARPLVRDAVLTGHDGEAIGLLLFLDPAGCAAVAGRSMDEAEAARDSFILAYVAEALGAHNRRNPGGSTRIAHFLAQTRGLVPGVEVTDKGYVNQRAVLAARAAEVARLANGEGCPVG